MLRIIIAFICLSAAVQLYPFETAYLRLDKGTAEEVLLKNPESVSYRVGGIAAEGLDPSRAGRHLETLNAFILEISNMVPPYSREDAARYLFTAMHRRFLKKYDLSATTLSSILETGRYNCLSSTLLYHTLCEAFGIKVRGAVLPTHIFTVLYTGTREIDVENTSPNGFDIGTNKAVQEQFRRLTGFEYSKDPAVCEIVDKRGVFSYLYANLAYFASKKNQVETVFQMGLRAAIVYPEGRYASTNVLAGYYAWSVELMNRSRYREAVSVLREGISNFDRDAGLVTNLTAAYTSYALYLAEKSNNYKGALEILAEARTELPDVRVIGDYELNVSLLEAENLANRQKDYEAAIKSLERTSRAFPGSDKVARGLLSVYNNYLIYLADSGRYEESLSVSRMALELYPDSQMVRKNVSYAISEYLKNLLESRRPEEAFRVYRESAAFDPEHARLGEWFYSRIFLSAVDNRRDMQTVIPIVKMALEEFPASRSIRENAVYALDRLSQPLANTKGFLSAERSVSNWYILDKKLFQPAAENFYGNTAVAYYNAGDIAAALDIVNRGLALVPASDVLKKYGSQIAGNTAGRHFKNRQYDKGIEMSKAALVYKPDDVTVKNNLKAGLQAAAGEAFDSGKKKKALEYSRIGVQYFPNDSYLQKIYRASGGK